MLRRRPARRRWGREARSLSLAAVAAAAAAAWPCPVAAAYEPSAASRTFLEQPPPEWPLPNGVDALGHIHYPAEWPWLEDDFRRQDEADDSLFYAEPRLVRHIDGNAIGALTRWYEANLPAGSSAAILDVCSSWISHFPAGLRARRVVGLGMNREELERNKQLTELVVHDLNKEPTLPFKAESFDAIVNAVSVDYLRHPLEVFREFVRVARPGALVAMSFSNRMFFTKAIARWVQASEFQRLLICASYFHFAGFTGVRAERVDTGRGDPMYVVFAHAPAPDHSPHIAAGASTPGAAEATWPPPPKRKRRPLLPEEAGDRMEDL